MLKFTDSFDWYSTANLLYNAVWSYSFFDEGKAFVSIGNQAETDSVCNVDATGMFRSSGLGDPINQYSEAYITTFLNITDLTTIFGCRFRPNVADPGYSWLRITNGVEPVELKFAADYKIECYVASVLQGTSPLPLTLGEQVVLEIKIFADVSGTVEVRVNGIPVIVITGVSTGSSGSYNSISIGMRGHDVSGDQPFCLDYDDVYVLDGVAPYNDFLGPTYHLHVKRTLADGSLIAWAPFGTLVNSEAANSNDGDTTYNRATPTPSREDRYTKTPLSASVQEIVGAQVGILAKGLGTCATELLPSLRVGGTTYTDTDLGVSGVDDEYMQFVNTWPVNPATGLPFTNAVINAAEFGVISQ